MVQNLSHDFGDTEPDGAYGGIRRYAKEEAVFDRELRAARAVFAQSEARARSLGMELRPPRLEQAARDGESPGCRWPWDSAYVPIAATCSPAAW
jgi:hypothetical protein